MGLGHGIAASGGHDLTCSVFISEKKKSAAFYRCFTGYHIYMSNIGLFFFFSFVIVPFKNFDLHLGKYVGIQQAIV